MKTMIPEGYRSLLSVYDTQMAIGLLHRLFEDNLRMHFSDRLFIVLSDSVCRSFEDLYQAVYGIDWSFCFTGKEAINVS